MHAASTLMEASQHTGAWPVQQARNLLWKLHLRGLPSGGAEKALRRYRRSAVPRREVAYAGRGMTLRTVAGRQAISSSKTSVPNTTAAAIVSPIAV